MPTDHTDQHLFARQGGDPRLNELANALTRDVRVRRMSAESAWDHSAIKEFYRQIHVLVG